jgi:uncharacterized protein (DUF362 family)
MRVTTLSLILSGFAVAAHATNVVDAVESPVIFVRDASAVAGFDVDATKVRAMISAGIKSLTGLNDEAAAWRAFASSNDVVGIKINVQAGPLQVTRPALVAAIADGLRLAGVATTNIIVWDRDAGKMRVAGYEVGAAVRGGSAPSTIAAGTAATTPPFRVQGVVPNGWDANAFYENKLVGTLIWGDLSFGKEGTGLSTRSHFPKVLTQTITKLINVPVLLDHDGCGLAGCLYNVSLGAMDNTRRFETLGQRGDPYIGEICKLPAIRDKLVLNVMDGLIGGYAGGPAFKPQYSWNCGALYLSRDPVAVDAVCLQLLEAKRREAKIPAIGSSAGHITTAARLGLGQSETNKIEVVEVKP